MARRFFVPTCAGMVCVFAMSVFAVAQQPGFSQIDVHNPFSSHYVSMTPVGGGWNGVSSAANFRTFGTSYAWSTGVFSPGLVVGYGVYSPLVGPYLGGPFVGNPFWGGPYFGGVAIAPLVAPPDGVLFGPLAMQRFLGVVDPPMPVVAQPQIVARQPAPPAAGGFGDLALDPAEKAARKARATNADARARSQRFIVLGDGYFAKQKYSDAYQRYKLALQAAPDMSDGFLRQGFALVALGRYEAAARSFKRGMVLAPDWPPQDFRLDQLYGDAGIAKAAHIEVLAQESLRAPSSDILFLLGLMLYCDGHRDKAFAPLKRASELSGGDDAHIQTLLRRVDPANQPPVPQPLARAKPSAGGKRVPQEAAVARRPAEPLPTPIAEPIAPFSKLPSAAATEAKRDPVPQKAPGVAVRPLPYGFQRLSLPADGGKDL